MLFRRPLTPTSPTPPPYKPELKPLGVCAGRGCIEPVTDDGLWVHAGRDHCSRACAERAAHSG